MDKYLITFVIGLLSWHVDFINMAFRLDGPARSLSAKLSLIGTTVFVAVAVLRLTRKRYLRLFFWMSVCFMLHHAVWFHMVQYSYVDIIPIRQSAPYFAQAWQAYVRDFGFWTIIWHEFVLLTNYLFYFFIAAIVTRIRIVWQAMMEEVRKGK